MGLHVKHTLKNFGNLKFFFDCTNSSWLEALCTHIPTISEPLKSWLLPSILVLRSRHARILCLARQTPPRNFWLNFLPERCQLSKATMAYACSKAALLLIMLLMSNSVVERTLSLSHRFSNG